MNIEIIKSLKERAKEMLEDNYDRKIGDEEIYTIICELENFYTAYKKEKRLAETNLKDSKEFQDNMCNHRCILNSEVEELEEELEKEKEKNKEYTMKINNLISQIESAIDFMKTDKLKIKVDMYQQKEEDLKLEIVHLKKLLKEE